VSPHCLRAAAGDESAKLTLKIAPLSLGSALQELARQSGVQIISREQMDQQNDTDLGDALANAVGITAVRSDSLSQSYYSRGFQVQS
jgi:outer-membrane receptor for ferric coprogen and ferric-rhodotorulic acid